MQKALGIGFSGLTDEARKTFKNKDSVKGVIVDFGRSRIARSLIPPIEGQTRVGHQLVGSEPRRLLPCKDRGDNIRAAVDSSA